MALTLATGTATGTLDLMDKFATWVDGLANWELTLHQEPGDMSGALDDRQVSWRRSSDSIYFHWQSDITAAQATRNCPMTLSKGAPSLGDEYDEHTNSATDTDSSARAGISLPQTSTDVSGNDPATLRYWFHADDDYMIVSVNMDGGWYQHFYAGLVRGFETPTNDCHYLCGSSTGNGNNASYEFDAASSSSIFFSNPFGPFARANTNSPYGVLYHAGLDEFSASIGATDPAGAGSHSFERFSVYLPQPHCIGAPIVSTYAANGVVVRYPITIFFPSPLSAEGAPRHFAVGNLQGVWYSPMDVLAEEAEFLVGSDNLLLLPAGKSRRVPTAYRYVGASILTTA